MSNAKLCVAVIILCLVTPMMVGYVWPTSSEATTEYEVGNPTNITSDFNNDPVGLYVDYRDPFMNNGFVLNSYPDTGLSVFDYHPVSTVSEPTQFVDHSDATWTSTYAYPVDGFYRVNLEDWIGSHFVGSDVYMFNRGQADEIDFGSGIVADTFVYYPKSNIAYYTYDGYSEIVTEIPEEIVFSFDETLLNPRILTSHGFANDYVDPSAGFYATGDYTQWGNGYHNRGFDAIIELDGSNKYMVFDLLSTSDQNPSWAVYVRSEDNGDIRFIVYHGSHLEYNGILGNLSVYPKVLLRVDYYDHSISLSGLGRMDSFTEDYQSKIRNTIKTEWNEPFEFTTFYYHGTTTTKYYIANTVSNVASVPGTNGSIDLKSYSSSNSQVQIRNLQLWDSSYHSSLIRINGTIFWPTTTSDGKWILPEALGGKTYNINNLVVATIERNVYFNGEIVYTSNTPITSLVLSFGSTMPLGEWLFTMYFYPIESIPSQEYGWESGGFGLDEHGYCIVGMITSAFTGLGASLYGRRSGAKMAVVTFVSGVIGAVYLVILMGGL